MSAKPLNSNKGILEIPTKTESDFLRSINTVYNPTTTESRLGSSPPHTIDLTESNELVYRFPRTRKFLDNTETLSISKPPEPRSLSEDNQDSRSLSKDKMSINRLTESSEPAATSQIESQEKKPLIEKPPLIEKSNSSTKLTQIDDIQKPEKSGQIIPNPAIYSNNDFKQEINKEIDSMRKTLEQQIESMKVLENQETNKKIYKLKRNIEETIQNVINDVRSLKDSASDFLKPNNSKNIEKVSELDQDLKYLYRIFMQLKEKVEVSQKNSNDSTNGIMSVIESYVTSLKGSIETRVKIIDEKTEDLVELKKSIDLEKRKLLELKGIVVDCIKKNRFKQFKYRFFRTLDYDEFLDLLDGYIENLPAWHRNNLIRSLDCLDLYRENHPIWLDYLRKNFANGKNWFVNSEEWIWVPFNGSLKEKIKHYVLYWEFVECETLNFVRNELGLNQVLVLGGGSFPYRITYLKCRLTVIPPWWIQMIEEFRGEGLVVVPKFKDELDEHARILQISRKRPENLI